MADASAAEIVARYRWVSHPENGIVYAKYNTENRYAAYARFGMEAQEARELIGHLRRAGISASSHTSASHGGVNDGPRSVAGTPLFLVRIDAVGENQERFLRDFGVAPVVATDSDLVTSASINAPSGVGLGS